MTTRRPFAVVCLAVALATAGRSAHAADSLIFVPLVPCRVIDTRVPGAGGPLVAGTPRSFVFRGPTTDYQNPTPFPNQGGSATGCGIPGFGTEPLAQQNLAQAVAVNIVAVGPSGGGDLRAWAANQPVPGASVLNYAAISGLNLANGVIVQMCDEAALSPCAGGDITFRADVSGTHLVVDVVGYFHAGATAATFSNFALGHRALQANTTGVQNTALGPQALLANTTGSSNTATGSYALQLNSTGYDNTAGGYGALANNTTRSFNTAFGARALYKSTSYDNTAVGFAALASATIGGRNTAVGARALVRNTTGYFNAASGESALYYSTTGFWNVALGAFAGSNITTGSRNIDIGNKALAADDSTTRIGDIQTRTFIAGVRGVTTDQNDAIPVLVDSKGQLGTASSSQRVKQDIADAAADSARILGLRPVRFRYRQQVASGDTTPQFGLIAEEVAKVFPELVVYDRRGRPETVKYQLLVPLLLGEVKEQDRQLVALRQEVERLAREVASRRQPGPPRR